ncbi:hypothetical protein ACOME3_004509 [Neoechinorhynchus agilis]
MTPILISFNQALYKLKLIRPVKAKHVIRRILGLYRSKPNIRKYILVEYFAGVGRYLSDSEYVFPNSEGIFQGNCFFVIEEVRCRMQNYGTKIEFLLSQILLELKHNNEIVSHIRQRRTVSHGRINTVAVDSAYGSSN